MESAGWVVELKKQIYRNNWRMAHFDDNKKYEGDTLDGDGELPSHSKGDNSIRDAPSSSDEHAPNGHQSRILRTSSHWPTQRIPTTAGAGWINGYDDVESFPYHNAVQSSDGSLAVFLDFSELNTPTYSGIRSLVIV
ncbi:hypothetical protein PC112_g14999 [Phytophthora cactorum]|nr:hypothetical protein PC112_g14999 [Phytophthora cactorum]